MLFKDAVNEQSPSTRSVSTGTQYKVKHVMNVMSLLLINPH